jgi:hypothetical protein
MIMKRILNNRFFSLYREKSGVISEQPCWVFDYDMYTHYNTSLLGLIWEVITEFKNDRHFTI